MGLKDKPWRLALDRTNWKFGRCHINILMLGIVHEKVCIPLFWVLLGKAGNSNARERTDLMSKLNETFPDQSIASLSGDREFIGERWMSWLESQGIPFVLRLKENMLIWKEGYVPVKLSTHARHLQKAPDPYFERHMVSGQRPVKSNNADKDRDDASEYRGDAYRCHKQGQNQNGAAHISQPLGHRNAVLRLENTRPGIGRYAHDQPAQIGDVDERVGNRILPRLQNRPLGCPHKAAAA